MDGKRKQHAIEQSCLFRVRSKKKLAEILYKSVSGLEVLANSSRKYRTWMEPKKNGGERLIEAPTEPLKLVQKRIADILQRIHSPNYLMAPVKGRSYVHNAAMHRGSRAFCLLDIEDFFPSCTDKKVYWFFHEVMRCESDIAAILTKIVTHNGHLPQGSPCSPILAYFAYSDMWGEVAEISVRSRCKLSIYADDITISGSVVYGRDVWQIKQILHRHGHKFSSTKERHLVNKSAEVTGVIVSEDRLLLPNRQHRKIVEARRGLQYARTSGEKTMYQLQLRGRFSQAKQILEHQ